MQEPDPARPLTVSYTARLHYKLAARGRLPMWTVYTPETREYSGFWVARMFIALPEYKPTRFIVLHDRLAGLHELLPPGLARICRSPGDAPEIVETWL